MDTQALDFPRIQAVLRADATGEVTINGTSYPIRARDEAAALKEALQLISGTAAQLGRPVKVSTIDPDGHGQIIVSPAGEVTELTPITAASTKQAPRRQQEPTTPASAPAQPAETRIKEEAAAPVRGPAETPGAAQAVEPAPVTFAEAAQPTPSPATGQQTEAAIRATLNSTSFLINDPVTEPATKGWRGTLTRLGLRMEPSAEELAEREDVRTVSQHWPGPRTVAVVNRKGGANKTPTVVMLAAVLARYGGGPVLAWDNNESQGTLGWRTEQGPHNASVLDLVDSSTRLLSPDTNSADLAHFVHHQTADKFDVLRSDENDEGDHEITAEEVDIVHRVATRYYRMIVMDSGSTARAANWRRMIDHTNQLVVPVTAMEDRAEAARLTLQTLVARGGHDAELAHNAVVIVSESTDARRGMSGDALKRAKAEAQRISAGFKPLVRAVVRVPYDPALVNSPIRYDALQPPTRRAWLAAAAAVAKGFQGHTKWLTYLN